MAKKTSKPKKKTATADRRTRPKATRRAPKERVIEDGKGEQGSEELVHQGTAAGVRGSEIARRKELEEYRHGGIPISSDPRE